MKRGKILLGLLFSVSFIFFSCSRQVDSTVLKGPYLGQNPPGLTPEVFAPGIISHGFHEHNLTISPDGDEMFFVTASSDYKHYVIINVRRINNVWSEPEIAHFSGKYSDMGPRFSPDGKKIFFCSKRPVPGSIEENTNYDLWMIDKKEESLSEPVNLGIPVNSDKNEAFPSIAANGTIYYHYWGEKGSESDIYFSRLKDGQYQKPQRLEFGISTEYYEGGPFIAPDESYLLFQAIRPDSFKGNTNIYISYRMKDNTWSKPRNLGESVNSSGYPISPMMSPDGKYIFFATNSTKAPFSYSGNSYSELINMFKSYRNGNGTLWWVDAKILDGLKPDPPPGNTQNSGLDCSLSK
ncbi:hypothetical protein ACFLT9_10930 [Acidobacteriota bacterium]